MDAKKTTEKVRYKWECPKCGAKDNAHGRGETAVCDRSGTCGGLLCECDIVAPLPMHGEVLDDPCEEANCYHCGWGGRLPALPKKLAPWEKKALEAGWAPPPARAKELKK